MEMLTLINLIYSYTVQIVNIFVYFFQLKFKYSETKVFISRNVSTSRNAHTPSPLYVFKQQNELIKIIGVRFCRDSLPPSLCTLWMVPFPKNTSAGLLLSLLKPVNAFNALKRITLSKRYFGIQKLAEAAVHKCSSKQKKKIKKGLQHGFFMSILQNF